MRQRGQLRATRERWRRIKCPTWRTHSCVPRRDSSRRLPRDSFKLQASIEMSLDAARTSDVVEKVPEQFSWARLGDIKWSTASFRSRVGPLIALAFLDDLWAKTFSTTSRVRALQCGAIRGRRCSFDFGANSKGEGSKVDCSSRLSQDPPVARTGCGDLPDHPGAYREHYGVRGDIDHWLH